MPSVFSQRKHTLHGIHVIERDERKSPWLTGLAVTDHNGVRHVTELTEVHVDGALVDVFTDTSNKYFA